MRFNRCFFAVSLVFSLMAGPALAQELPTVKLPEQRPLGKDLPVYVPEVEYPELPDLPAELGLDQARRLTLVYNPSFQTLAWELRARQAALLQAGMAPNPSFDLTAEDVVGSAFYAGQSFSQTTWTLIQPLLLGDKIGKRQQVARLNAELAGWDLERRRLEVLSEVSQRFVDVLEAQDTLALSQEIEKISDETLKTIQAQVAKGEESALEANRAGVVVANSRLDVEQTELALEQAREELASLWGGGGSDFERVAGNLEPGELPSLESLLAELPRHPDIARWETELEQRQAVLDLEQAMVVPDLNLAAAVRHHIETNDIGGVFGISLNLPVWDRNQGNIAFANLRRQKALEERDRATVSLRKDLRAAWARLRRAHGTVEMLEKTILPEAEKTFLGIRSGYEQNKFSYLEVLEAQRNFFEARLRAVQARGEFYRALSLVESLSGLALEEGRS